MYDLKRELRKANTPRANGQFVTYLRESKRGQLRSKGGGSPVCCVGSLKGDGAREPRLRPAFQVRSGMRGPAITW